MISIRNLPSALLLLAVPASAQSFNIDFTSTLSSAGTPSDSYGGAAGQFGRWNSIGGTGSFNAAVLDLAGNPTAVQTQVVGAFGAGWFNNTLTTGDDQALLDDFLDPTGGVLLRLNGLAPGYYEIVIYAWAPDLPGLVTSIGLGGPQAFLVGGGDWTGTHVQGLTYERFATQIVNGSIQFSFTVPAGSFATCNGLQMRRLPYQSTCFGSTGGAPGCTPCPCGNQDPTSLSPVGCANSTGSGAFLAASGLPRVSTAADTLHFGLLLAPPSSFAVLVSGAFALPNNSVNPCFGSGSGVLSAHLDGLRCVGGDVRRHGSRALDAGGATPVGWGPPDQPLAGLGATSGFVAGQTRHFQCFYRDLLAAGCGTGQNTSNAVVVTFQ